MNFFSHAAVAGRFSAEPSFVLGAMLPDFASMLGVPAVAMGGAPAGSAALWAGVRFHHRTDAAFHGLSAFTALCREAASDLRERGVRRGPSLAVAHVGVELFVDAALAERAEARRAYLNALRAGTSPELLAGLDAGADERRRFARLFGTLIERGVTVETTPRLVLERLRRSLSRRPRLALAPGDEPGVLGWVESARTRIVASAPELVAGLFQDLARRSSDPVARS